MNIPEGPGRLPTFRPPRDLTLSNISPPKKVFVPNVTQNQRDSSPTTSATSALLSQLIPKANVITPKQKASTPRKRNPNPPMTKRDRHNLIQTQSIFTTGAPTTHKRPAASPKISYLRPKNQKLERRDTNVSPIFGFDDLDRVKTDLDLSPTRTPKSDPSTAPFTLPFSTHNLLEQERISQARVDDKTELEQSIEIDQPSASTNYEPNSSSQVMEMIEEDDYGLKLLQFPNELPLLESASESEAGQNDNNESQKKSGNTLEELPDKLLGKLQCTRSGLTRLVIGDNVFNLKSAVQTQFRQEVFSIDLDNRSYTNLGPVRDKIIVTPSMESFNSHP